MKKSSSKFKIKSLLAFTLLLTMVILAACGGDKTSNTNGEGDKKPIKIQVGGSQAPTTEMKKAADNFAKTVEEKSNGEIDVEILFGGVLGGEREMTEAVQLGNIQMGFISDIGYSSVFSELGFSFLPYLVTNYEEVDSKYYNGWIGEEFTKILDKNGIHVLEFFDNDFRWVVNSKHPVSKPKDIKGMSLRVPEISELTQFFKELGALPTNMAITEVVPALQQGTVDGQDNGSELNYTMGFYEFQPYMTKTNHVFSGGAVGVNKEFWNSLSQEHRDIISEAANIHVNEGTKGLRASAQKNIKAMEEKGVEIIEPSPELVKAMKEAAQKVWENPENVKRYGQDIVDKILSE